MSQLANSLKSLSELKVMVAASVSWLKLHLNVRLTLSFRRPTACSKALPHNHDVSGASD